VQVYFYREICRENFELQRGNSFSNCADSAQVGQEKSFWNCAGRFLWRARPTPLPLLLPLSPKVKRKICSGLKNNS